MTCSLTCLETSWPRSWSSFTQDISSFPHSHSQQCCQSFHHCTRVPFPPASNNFCSFPFKASLMPFQPTVSSMHFCPPFSPNASATCFRLCYNHTHFQELNLAPEESSQKEWLKTAAITILFSSTRLLMRILFSSTRKSMQHFRIECWKLRPGQSVLTELVSVEILESRVKRI